MARKLIDLPLELLESIISYLGADEIGALMTADPAFARLARLYTFSCADFHLSPTDIATWTQPQFVQTLRELRLRQRGLSNLAGRLTVECHDTAVNLAPGECAGKKVSCLKAKSIFIPSHVAVIKLHTIPSQLSAACNKLSMRLTNQFSSRYATWTVWRNCRQLTLHATNMGDITFAHEIASFAAPLPITLKVTNMFVSAKFMSQIIEQFTMVRRFKFHFDYSYTSVMPYRELLTGVHIRRKPWYYVLVLERKAVAYGGGKK